MPVFIKIDSKRKVVKETRDDKGNIILRCRCVIDAAMYAIKNNIYDDNQTELNPGAFEQLRHYYR